MDIFVFELFLKQGRVYNSEQINRDNWGTL